MPTKHVRQLVNELLSNQEAITNRDVVRRTSISRQAVHAHLRALVEGGELIVEGAGRRTG